MTPARNKVGRPSKRDTRPQSLNLLVGNAKRAKAEVLDTIRRAELGMGAATRHAGLAGSNEHNMKKSPVTTPPVPERSNPILTDEQIRMVLYVLRLVLIEKEEFKAVSTADPFHRAAYYTGVSHMTLRDLWNKYLASQGTSAPPPVTTTPIWTPICSASGCVRICCLR